MLLLLGSGGLVLGSNHHRHGFKCLPHGTLDGLSALVDTGNANAGERLDAHDRLLGHGGRYAAGAVVGAFGGLARIVHRHGGLFAGVDGGHRLFGTRLARQHHGQPWQHRPHCGLCTGLEPPIFSPNAALGVCVLRWHGGHANLVGRTMVGAGGGLHERRSIGWAVWYQLGHVGGLFGVGMD